MAEQLPVNFAIPGEGTIASYDWTDIAASTGYITFYCGAYYPFGGSTTYVLSNKPFWSDASGAYTTASLNSVSTVIDKDFDTLINKPLVLQGKSIINVPFAKSQLGGAQHLHVYIRKWNGVTETEIADAAGTAVNNQVTAQILTAFITIPTTSFKKGEYLRVTIQIITTQAVDSTGWIAHDPMEATLPAGDLATFNDLTTILSVQIPVRIDL